MEFVFDKRLRLGMIVVACRADEQDKEGTVTDFKFTLRKANKTTGRETSSSTTSSEKWNRVSAHPQAASKLFGELAPLITTTARNQCG